MTGGERRSEPDEGPVAPERPRRTPPTIDATATELTEPATDGPVPPPPESSEPPESPEPPAGEFQPGSARDFLSEDSAAAAHDKPGGIGPRSGFSLGMLAAGFAGGLVVLLVLFVLWLTGLVPIRYAGSTAMRARVAVLEMQVQELANRPATGAKAREELAQRLDKVEQTLAQPQPPQAQAAAPDPALEQRLAAAEAAMKSLGDRVDAGAARIESAEKAATDAAAAAKSAATSADKSADTADRAAHDHTAAAPDPALVARLDAAAREAAAAQTAMQTALAGAATERTRIKAALAALTLRDGALGGRPFAAELAAAKSLGVDAATLAALEPWAATGVPGEAALGQELTALLPALRKAAESSKTSKASSTAEPNQAQGFLDRLEANASRLIRIRPVGEIAATGSDPAAVIARAGALAAKPDVAGAAAALKTLPVDLRAPADQWIARVAARQAAREAAGGLAAVAARLLGPS